MAKQYGSTIFFKDQVNREMAGWIDFVNRIYPAKRSCVPVIREVTHRMLRQLDQFQINTGNPMPEEMYQTKYAKLTTYVQTCIRTEGELPKNVDQAIDALDKTIVLQATLLKFKNEVMDWNKRFYQANDPTSKGCPPLVQQKASEILQQLEQMNDRSPDDLLELSLRGGEFLERCASRCLEDGVAAVPLGLPKDLQVMPSENLPPSTRKPNPDMEMSD